MFWPRSAQKMVNFKLNYGVHKVEKAWQNFPHFDWLVKIMTSWERQRRHENFEDVTKLAMSVHRSANFCATDAWGLKEIIIYYKKNLNSLLFSWFYFNLQAVGRYWEVSFNLSLIIKFLKKRHRENFSKPGFLRMAR